jgi:putative transposase
MQVIKSISAREFFKLYSEVKGDIFGQINCGLKAILSKQFEIATEDTIRKYVKKQLVELDKKRKVWCQLMLF